MSVNRPLTLTKLENAPLWAMAYHSFILAAAAVTLVGCVGPPPGGSGSANRGAGQNCAVCIEENPGDVVVCEAICHEHLGDTAGPNAGSVLR